MARPRKNADERQTCRLPHVRCTEAEYARIQARAAQAGLTQSEFIRRMALEGQVQVIVYNDEQSERRAAQDPAFELVYQLRKIGVNLNTYTRELLQTGRSSPHLLYELQKLDGVLDRLMS